MIISEPHRTTIDTAPKAYEILAPQFNPQAEEFWALYLTHHLELIKIVMLHKGTLNYCKIHPRDLFREAVFANCYAIVIAHNHTGASVEPSIDDLKITRKLKKCSMLLEIPIIDHIVFNKTDYYSFKENKIF